ncbi:hypothetical protein C7H19_13785 [Aphanothece hegewaldii CCALA 016]|uniref:ATPase AAA-type core domain-containing protein n=1 Tax=Aphanothece hegewaldii CCALA 016 TaxID=2107694 RepID=A0A2T1LWJ2_9CHRO|nr:ATP-binding protein [Aphanothece hegewaldii]PSF36272.1 hypothetical protein C7H19_13785 [Aphanothece hegewaldii CCALA 016]
MKIKKLEYYDKEYEWKLELVEFLPNLNLLVGISGAGKTSILKAIRSLQAIATGESLNGVGWDVLFLTDENTEYRWIGEFETQESQIYISGEDEESKEKNRFKIIQENIYVNNDVILDRTENKIIFDNKQTPKLSPVTSIVELLSQEDKILPIRDAFKKIIFSQSDGDLENLFIGPIYRLNKYDQLNIDQLKASNIPIEDKLFIAYQNHPQVFQQIKDSFTNIFTKVEDIKIASWKSIDSTNIPISLANLLRDAAVIQIKERGINQWIIRNISSGMLKSLMFIAELYLSSEGSVILIDEFENSLGVNCLNSITNDILLSNYDRQYIITSHHPYIINNISPEYWKIVTRKGSTITVHNAEDFHISPTRQKAFIELINVLEDFPEGIDNE